MAKNIKAQITDDLHTRAKVRAALEGISLIDLLVKSLEHYLQSTTVQSHGSREA